MSKYLAKGEKEYAYIVRNNYAINVDLNGSLFTVEASSNYDGWYDQNDNPLDEEIKAVYEHVLSKETHGFSGKTVSNIFDIFIRAFEQQDFSPVVEQPKLVKSLAQGLENQGEVMTFYLEEEKLSFACFGNRLVLDEALNSLGRNTINISPLSWYYVTKFSGPVTFLVAENMIIVANDDKTAGGVIMDINMTERESYRSNNYSLDKG